MRLRVTLYITLDLGSAVDDAFQTALHYQHQKHLTASQQFQKSRVLKKQGNSTTRRQSRKYHKNGRNEPPASDQSRNPKITPGLQDHWRAHSRHIRDFKQVEFKTRNSHQSSTLVSGYVSSSKVHIGYAEGIYARSTSQGQEMG
jgi:hypothetical protein